jgi:superfamily II DNA or RNA helicase
VKITFNNVWATATELERGDEIALEIVADQLAPFMPGYRYFPAVKSSLEKMKEKHKGMRSIIFRVMRELERDPEYLKRDATIPPQVREWFARWRVRLLSPRTGQFPTGLLPLVVQLLEGQMIRPTLVDQRTTRMFRSHSTTKVPLRDYQYEGLFKAFTNQEFGLWWPRGVLYHATGAGKTETAAAMIETAGVPTIFLVHRLDLLSQTAERFRKYGLEVGVIGDGEYNPSYTGVTVATVQSLHSLKKAGKDFGWHQFEQVFFDEAHLIAAKYNKGNLFVDIAANFQNAYMRWGLTATPGMRDKFSNWLLEGVTGQVLHSVRSKTLIEDGWLTPPKVIFDTAPKVAGISSKSWAEAYTNGIVLNAGRNKRIVEWAKQLPKPCLVLVSHVAHGEILQRVMQVPFVHGGTPSDSRSDMIACVRRGEKPVIIASTIFDEGVDIPELRSIVLAGAGRSQIKVLQRIGRGLRLADEKDVVTIVDFIDQTHKTLKSHSQERMATCQAEGFTVLQSIV